ncbi:MAG: anthranilate phosphoribosyltransferase [Duodenibacillus sp.]
MMTQELLSKLFDQHDLTKNEAQALFTEVFNGTTDPAVFAALLTALKIKKEAPQEIAGAATAMVNAAVRFPRPEGLEIGEIVGTGGDGMHSINVSTISALCAAANGLKIVKHGNRSISSQTGASDLLEALGFNIAPDPADSAKLLEESGFAFCFAQRYHPAMKNVMPVRKALATRTIFNILGPVTNPARPDYAVIGVYLPELILPVAQTLRELGMKRAFVVHGSGFDEVAVHGPTAYARLLEDGTIRTGELTAEDFGVKNRYRVEDFQGGKPEENTKLALNILTGHGTDAQNDMICANLSLLLVAGGRVADIAEGVALARETLADGRALKVIEVHRRFNGLN